jgi:hypothetical protein
VFNRLSLPKLRFRVFSCAFTAGAWAGMVAPHPRHALPEIYPKKVREIPTHHTEVEIRP